MKTIGPLLRIATHHISGLMRHQRVTSFVFAAALALPLMTPDAQAQTNRTWDNGKSGAGADDWGQKNNWSNNNLPDGNTEIARFAGSNAGSSSIEINTDLRTGGITFNSDLSVNISFTNAAKELSIRNGGASYGIINNSSRTLTFANKMGIEADMTWSSTHASGGGMNFQNTVDTDGYNLTLLTTNSNNTINVSGAIIDSGGVTKTGDGTLIYSGTNTYTGTTTVNGGTLQLNASNTIADASNLVIGADGTVKFNWGVSSETVGALSGSGTLELRGTDFTTSTTANTTFSGTITDSYGSFHKAGTGDLTLSGNNTYTGLTYIEGGTLIAASNTALGAATHGNVIFSGATLGLQGGITLSESNFSLQGTGDGGVGAINNISGNNTLTSSLTFTGATTIGSASGNLTLSNQLSLGSALTMTGAGNIESSGQITGSGSLTKNGSGTLTLSGGTSNSHTGGSYINDGTVILNKTPSEAGNGALGQSIINIGDGSGSAGSAIVRLNADHQIANYAGITTIASDGRLDLNGNNEGIKQLQGTGQVTLGAGTLSLGVNSASSSFGGVISGTGNLTKEGSGTVTLSGSNTFTGTTTVNGGTLELGANNVLSDSTAVTINSGTFDVNDKTDTVGSIAGAGNINLGSGTLTAGGNNTSTTFSGVISETGNLTKAGTGTLTLSGNNTYSGTTTVSNGILVAAHNNALGANTANAIVNSGGTISLDGGVTVTKTSGTLSLNSSGASASTGSLHAGGSTGTTSQWVGNVALTGNSTISAADNLLMVGNINTLSNTLNLGSNTLTLNTPSSPTVTPVYTPYPSYPLDPTNILINSVISGSGGINKTGAGTATMLSGNKNTFTGDTNITGGKLIVDGSGFYNSPVISSSNVTIGNASGAGAADSVILQMGQLSSPGAGFPVTTGFIGTYNAGTLTASTALTIYEDGLFDMNGGENAFSGITLKGGHITGRDPSSSPLLTIAGDVTTLASSQTALIEEGEVGMSKDAFTFNVANGAADVDLQIDSILHNGIGYTASTTSTINKTGSGTMVLTGNNDYVGITQVQQGILNIQNNTALGQSSTPFGSTGNGTVVSSGAQLQIEGGLTVGKETLSLSGTGVGNTGALLNKADDNTYNGYVILDADARINANSGTTLNIANTSGVNAGILNGASAGKNLTVGGAGDTIINGSIGSYVNNITKDGTGTLTLAGYNGYAGATNVTSGAVKITHDNGLSGTGAIVTSGAALQFAQDATNADIDVVGVNATINGTGLSNGGAIQNLNGDNSYLGAITLGSDSRITAEAGSSLTLNGNVYAAANHLEVGGAGDTTYNGRILGENASLTKTDSGTVTFSGTSSNEFGEGLNINNGTVNLNKTAGVNAIADGTVTVGDSSGSANSANLVVQANNQMADSIDLVLNSDGRIQMGTAEDAISTIAGTGQIDLGASGRLIIGDDNSSSTFGGSITSDDINGTLEKNGSGTLTLTSDISYDGTLELGGGTLKLSDIDLTVGALVITADTTIDFSGASTLNVGTFSFLSTSYTLNIINWDKNVDYFYSAAWTGGTQDTTGILPMNQVVFDGFLGDQTIWDSYDDEIYPTIPEPSTYGMIFFGAAAALVVFKRRRDRRKADVKTSA